MSFHNSQIRNHIPHNWTFADSTAREDTTDPNSGLGYASADLYKLARQTDDDSLWMLTAVTPTWQNVSGGSSTATVPTAVEGNVLIGDSTPEWALLDASADTKVLVGNGTTLASYALSGDVTMANTGVVTIADDAVTLAKLANVTRCSLIVGGASDAPTLLSGKTLGAILIGDGTDITSTINPSIAGNVGIGGTLTVNTTDLVVNSTGVGICETTIPTGAKLAVGGGIAITNGASSSYFLDKGNEIWRLGVKEFYVSDTVAVSGTKTIQIRSTDSAQNTRFLFDFFIGVLPDASTSAGKYLVGKLECLIRATISPTIYNDDTTQYGALYSYTISAVTSGIDITVTNSDSNIGRIRGYVKVVDIDGDITVAVA